MKIESTNAETSAMVGEELAALLRAMLAGRDVHLEAFAALCRMMEAEANSPRDALALLVAARSLLTNALLPAFANSQQGTAAYAVHLVLGLVGRSIEALETATGEKAGAFAGNPPVALN